MTDEIMRMLTVNVELWRCSAHLEYSWKLTVTSSAHSWKFAVEALNCLNLYATKTYKTNRIQKLEIQGGTMGTNCI